MSSGERKRINQQTERTRWNSWPKKVKALYPEVGEPLSRFELGELGLNMGGPPSKAKYSWTTDSEPVRRLNDEKNPYEGCERVPETVCLQAVGALRGDRVLFA